MGKRKTNKAPFIVLEGIDGAGTTSQQRSLVSWLQSKGQLVHGTHQPTDGPIGNMIRQILRGRLVACPPGKAAEPVDPAAVALLFAADRVDHLRSQIVPTLEGGHWVICDRYVLSSLAYQSLETDLRFVRQINEKAIAPDLTIFLRVRPDVAMARIAATRVGRESFEKLGIQRRVAEAYDKLIAEQRGRVVIIDGEQNMSTVTTEVRAAVESFL